jgi:hypothetical protein
VKAVKFLALLALYACSEDSSPKAFTFSNLTFDLPAEWQQSGSTIGNVSTWTPKDNDHGESIVLIRADAPSDLSDDPSRLNQLLEDAQGTLTDNPVAATAVRTAGGFAGSRVDLDYVPPGAKTPYHRAHLVLVDGTQLVHVLYTARTSDPNLGALKTLLQTLHQA